MNHVKTACFLAFYIGLLCIHFNLLPIIPCYALSSHSPSNIKDEQADFHHDQNISITLNRNLLSVTIDHVRLATVLEEISNKAGIPIYYYGSSEATISAIISNLRFEDAIKRLARAKGYVFIYESAIGREPSLIPRIVYIYPASSEKRNSSGRSFITADSSYSDNPALSSENLSAGTETVDDHTAKENDESFDQMVNLAINDQEIANRIASIEFLAVSGRDQAVDTLIQTLEDPEPRVRVASAYALGQYADQRSLNALKAVLQDPVPEVKRAAMIILDEMDKGEKAESDLNNENTSLMDDKND